MATHSPPRTVAAAVTASATFDIDDSPWDEIEKNYFDSMRLHREQEDVALEEDHRAQSEDLRLELVDNYNAQAKLLRQLQALREQYDTKHSKLGRLDSDFEATKEERRCERGREDEERRQWFRTFRRGGLAYRGAEEKARVPAGNLANGHGNGATGAETEDDQPVDRGRWVSNAGRIANGHGKGLSADETGDEHLAEPQSTDGAIANGHVHEASADGTSAERPAELDSEMPDAAPIANAQEQQLQLPEKEFSDAETPGNGPQTAETLDSKVLGYTQQQEPEVAEMEMPDTKAFMSGKQQHSSAENDTRHPETLDSESRRPETPALEQDLLNGTPSHGQHQREPAKDTESAYARTPVHGEQQVESPGMDYMADVRPTDEGDCMDGVEVVAGPERPEDPGTVGVEGKPSVEASGPDQKAGIPAAADHEAGNTTIAEEQVLAVKTATMPADNGTPEPTRTQEDVVMADVQASPQNANSPEIAGVVAQTTAAAPTSPSSSSELSSRHTTPELDTPVSLPGHASPEDATSGAIEVIDESGDWVGRLQPLSTSNYLVERISEFPIKRQVRIRSGRKLTADDLEAVPRPQTGDARAFKFLSFYVQATGEQQERPCVDCSSNHGPYQGCVMVDDPEFPRCGNCEWNKRRCHGAALQRPSSARRSLPAGLPANPPAKARMSGGSFTEAEDAEEDKEQVATTPGKADQGGGSEKKGPRKLLPTTRKAHRPSTPLTASFLVDDDDSGLPEISKDMLCLRDDGVVFTDPPLMRGVPVAKITSEHPYWEPTWRPINELVEPILQKHQEKYEQLEQAGSTHRDKHLANRDAKRGRTILKFLEEGELHPYQLVGKDWLNTKLTHYDTLFRLAQLLLEELPKMNLDVTPSQWLRHRLNEVYLEKGDKFDVATWLAKAYHDRKVEQLREKNGFARVGRPPAHAMKNTDPGSSSKKVSAPRSLKRKDPHATPGSTPSKSRGENGGKASPTATPAPSAAAASASQQKPKKIKIVTIQTQSTGESSTYKKPRIILNSPAPPSAVDGASTSVLDYDGYTSTDSISEDRLEKVDYRLQQVKTRSIASNTRVTQYWHWLGGAEGFFEHQVLRSVRPPKWSVFKDPYDFHLRLVDIREATFARGNTKVIIAHKKGKDGQDLNPRGDVMAQFKRERTKKRFLSFLKKVHGVKLVEVSSEYVETKWNSLTPDTLPAGDSD